MRECAVVVREDVPGTKRLTAYLVPEGEMPAALVLRSALSAKLHDYMVPQLFVPLSALPLTPNGKVDRRALVRLPAPEGDGAASRAYVAPRDPVEEILAEVWAEVLHLERVGVTDNFFELGGDSILTIQVVARCKKRGLKFAPRQLFQHQTVAALAAVAEMEVRAEQNAGPVPLTPAQALLLQAGGPAFERWSQAVLLEPPADPEGALSRLIARHDALRLRFVPREDGTWSQRVLDPADPAARIPLERIAGAIRDGVDLVTAPVQAALFSPPGGPDRLLLAAHPMVLDVRSFQILAQDLAGAPTAAPASFRSLALAMKGLRPTQAVTDDPEARMEKAAETLWVGLEPGETQALLEDVSRAYGNTVEEVLLAALTEAYTGWSGAQELVAEVEGDVLDRSLTAGCLAIPCPVHLEGKRTPGDLLKEVKEQLRSFSRLDQEAQVSPVPDLGLRWMGERGEWLPSRRDPGALRRHLLDVEGSVSAGEGNSLRVAWTFSTRVYRRDAVQALAERFLRSLRSLIQHCQSPEAGGFTPSDFPGAGLSQEDLDDLLAELS